MKAQTIFLRDEGLRQRAIQHIAGLNLDRHWEITIKPHTKRRTLSQNGLMFLWVDRVVAHVQEHIGHDKDDIHEFFKQKFLQPRIVQMGGDERVYYSSKNLTTAEMSEYMDRIYAFCTSDLGLFLPVPEDLGRDKAA